MSIIFTIIILGIIIFVHELGHFFTAKYFKMPVHEFAIGMGPKIISKRKGDTVYSVRALPLGGFVNIGGMQYEEITEEMKNTLTEKELHKIKSDNENGFYKKSAFARLIVLIAGVSMNFITSIIGIYMLFFITNTIPFNSTPAIIGSISEKSKITNILKENDRIIELNGVDIKSWQDLTNETRKINEKENAETLENKEFNIKLIRNEKEKIEENIKLTYNEELKSYLIGITLKENTMKFNSLDFINKLKISVITFKEYFVSTFEGVKMLITGRVKAQEMTGIVGLPKLVGQAYNSAGYIALLSIFILLSINIGIMNLLPFPALDGGRLLFVIPEFFGIKINKKIEEKIHFIGIILLIILMIFTIFNDTFKYIGR